MIGLILNVYTGLLNHYHKKWNDDKIDSQYQEWEEAQQMRAEMGFDAETRRQIPKRKIRSQHARKKHCY